MLSQFRILHLRVVASSRLDFRIDILKIDPTALRRPRGRRRGRYMTIRECAFYVFESIVNYSPSRNFLAGGNRITAPQMLFLMRFRNVTILTEMGMGLLDAGSMH